MIRPDLGQRMRWLLPYFGAARGAWALALVATVVAAATEPLMPALLKPLLDRGFKHGSFPLWMVPAALLLLFARARLGRLPRRRGAGQDRQRRHAARCAATVRAACWTPRLALFSRAVATALSNTVVYEVQNGCDPAGQRADWACSRTALTLVALLAYLLYLNWQLTLIVVLHRARRGLDHAHRVAPPVPDRPASQHATNDLAYVVEENVLAAPRGAPARRAGRRRPQRFDAAERRAAPPGR